MTMARLFLSLLWDNIVLQLCLFCILPNVTLHKVSLGQRVSTSWGSSNNIEYALCLRLLLRVIHRCIEPCLYQRCLLDVAQALCLDGSKCQSSCSTSPWDLILFFTYLILYILIAWRLYPDFLLQSGSPGFGPIRGKIACRLSFRFGWFMSEFFSPAAGTSRLSARYLPGVRGLPGVWRLPVILGPRALERQTLAHVFRD